MNQCNTVFTIHRFIHNLLSNLPKGTQKTTAGYPTRTQPSDLLTSLPNGRSVKRFGSISEPSDPETQKVQKVNTNTNQKGTNHE